jgi:hypothetical protein
MSLPPPRGPAEETIWIILRLSSDDPEWPQFLVSRATLLEGTAEQLQIAVRGLDNYPEVRGSVCVRLGEFKAAVRAYENAYHRRSEVESLVRGDKDMREWAITSLDELSNNCRLGFIPAEESGHVADGFAGFIFGHVQQISLFADLGEIQRLLNERPTKLVACTGRDPTLLSVNVDVSKIKKVRLRTFRANSKALEIFLE